MKKIILLSSVKPVQGNWWILSETFNNQKQEGERLHCIAVQPSTVNVFHGKCFVFITLNFNTLLSLHALNEFQLNNCV